MQTQTGDTHTHTEREREITHCTPVPSVAFPDTNTGDKHTHIHTRCQLLFIWTLTRSAVIVLCSHPTAVCYSDERLYIRAGRR